MELGAICLDAGHYGKYNRSPAVKTYYESDMAWKLTMLQKKYLEQYGFPVILTRSDKDKDLSVTSRGRAAKGCILFISNHSNAVGSKVDETVDYASVYHLTDDSTTKVDNISMAIAAKLAPVIAETMGTKQGHKILSRKSDYDRNGDGVMNDNYYGVLHGARSVGVPGLILEHSFHTNTRSTNWLLDDGNLDKLAKAEVAAIAAYYGVETPVTDESSSGASTSDKSETVLYYVQAGSYGKKENAEAQMKKIKAKGFDVCITLLNGQYKIQVGAFSKKENAEAQLAKVKKASFDAFITTQGGKAVAESTTKKSVKEIALEVIQGKWGNGETRKKKLTAAGYNYKEVQDMVNELSRG